MKEKGAMNLKEGREGFMGVFGERKEKREMIYYNSPKIKS